MNPLVGRPWKSPRFADVHRVISLEGVGAGRKYSAHSDKKALFIPFDRKRLFAAVRTALPRRGANDGKRTVQDAAREMVDQLAGFGDVPAADRSVESGAALRVLPPR
jgi:hypothetical protein